MKVTAVVRDVLLCLAAIAVIAFVATRFLEEQAAAGERLDRLTVLQARINNLDTAYKKIVFDGDARGIYQQIFRQNEILLEYQKLLLIGELLPIDQAAVLGSMNSQVK